MDNMDDTELMDGARGCRGILVGVVIGAAIWGMLMGIGYLLWKG